MRALKKEEKTARDKLQKSIIFKIKEESEALEVLNNKVANLQ